MLVGGHILSFAAPQIFSCERGTRQEATNGIRTHDLPLTKRVLCQLSYSGWEVSLVAGVFSLQVRAWGACNCFESLLMVITSWTEIAEYAICNDGDGIPRGFSQRWPRNVKINFIFGMGIVPLAQWLEHWSYEPRVMGSNPIGDTPLMHSDCC